MSLSRTSHRSARAACRQRVGALLLVLLTALAPQLGGMIQVRHAHGASGVHDHVVPAGLVDAGRHDAQHRHTHEHAHTHGTHDAHGYAQHGFARPAGEPMLQPAAQAPVDNLPAIVLELLDEASLPASSLRLLASLAGLADGGAAAACPPRTDLGAPCGAERWPRAVPDPLQRPLAGASGTERVLRTSHALLL